MLSSPDISDEPNMTQEATVAQASCSHKGVIFSTTSGKVKYQDLTVIGDGAYGTVYKARDLQNNGNFVALKKVKVALTTQGIPVDTIREIAVLRRLGSFDHPNIVKLLDICSGCRFPRENRLMLFLVFEHIEQDLRTYLDNFQPPGLMNDKIKIISYQILKGLDFLHSNRVIHRDLKPQNILITNDGRVKLADFGLARIYDAYMTFTSVVVTLWYRPPEVLLQREYATPVDIWSAGCIIAELAKNSPLFPGENEICQLSRILEIMGTPPESDWPQTNPLPLSAFKASKGIPLRDIIREISDDGIDLIQRMLLFSPSQRVCCRDALNHPYFRNFH